MGAYEKLTCIFGVMYIGMYPLMYFRDGAAWKFLVLEATDEQWTEETTTSMKSLFLLLGVVVGGGYMFAAYLNSTNFIDMTVVQRLFIVSPCILLTALLKQDPVCPEMIKIMFVADCVGGIVHGMTAPGGIMGVLDRFSKFLKKTPTSAEEASLMVESYIGLATTVAVVMYAALMPAPPLSIMTLMVSKLQYLWFLYASLDQTNRIHKKVPYARVFVVAAELFVSEVYGFCQLPLRLDAVSTFLGTANPFLSTIGSSVSFLYLYYVMATHILTVENGPMNWIILWGILIWLSSEAWVFLFYVTYDDAQKKRLMNTNWQDRILCVFMIALGGVLANDGGLASDTMGENVIYLLPIVTLWFTLQTKLLNHLQVGTPFHPTWWVDCALPKYAPSDWINVSFSLATTLITAVLTTYAFIAVMRVIGFASFSFDEDSIRKFSGVHGITFVFHSGLWMIVASSGVPNLGKGKAFSVFQPKVPVPLPANPHHCIPAHKIDLVIGCTLLFLSAFSLNDDLGEGQENTFKYLTFIAWALTVANKVRIHIQDWGYTPPCPNGKVVKQD